ncbi:nitrogen regulation protein NR(II) [Halomonas elongata]|uniref:Sensory histidine kinase/phosphatase NtrB n=2 Tax=Halomonas elongata TaxID=2746 RepID=E1V4W2_HALED|nr:nitrogen regulation protein NR(II) [Halomonas elongata]OBX35142.1 nitrogen regulation protein NR(II) [Halomonas elongata]RAW08473.1 nitrogen regulation protein NR(II) [Halomonas elongata]WPU47101.1 nitrogen regulation protein NR(II) [Halomonas elongata DSM 2581]WVI71776.1 nitrogen regulation protein NR(II) [Halomonas elongata]CBV41011.1 PAS domain protein / sensor histidine kinase NtrB [Halomonas elongata DSM 2581]
MYQRLMEHLTTAVLLLDGGLRLQWMNPAAEALLALSRSRVTGQPLPELVVGEEDIGELLAKARDEFHPFTQREARLTLVTGDVLTVDYTVTPLSRDELLLEVEPRDRLLRISREEALQTRQETIKVLARGLAHEVKNPLGGIRGAAQLLERDLESPQLTEFTRIIIEEVDRLRDMVDAMLGPNQVERHEPLNIHKVLERVRSLLTVEHPSVTIIRDYDPSLPDLVGDESQMIQAMLNVARNAVEAMTESDVPAPSLMLRTRARRQFTLGAERHRLVCEVSIIDNGPGIPERLRETLFYPMVSGRAEGSGLGLSIAQSILHQHQGLIECDSAPGHTEFRLLIPLEKSHE